ncbi:hypothetical protein GCM10023319_13400 [Nocardia iowensis]
MVMVVVAEHRGHRHWEVGDFGTQQLGFGAGATVGEVAGQQEYVGMLGEAQKVGAKLSGHGGTQMRIGDGRDPDTPLRGIGWHTARQPHRRRGVNRNPAFIRPLPGGELPE